MAGWLSSQPGLAGWLLAGDHAGSKIPASQLLAGWLAGWEGRFQSPASQLWAGWLAG